MKYTIIQSIKFNRSEDFETEIEAINALKNLCNRTSDTCYLVKTKDIIFPKQE